jgi:hypothetical protein
VAVVAAAGFYVLSFAGSNREAASGQQQAEAQTNKRGYTHVEKGLKGNKKGMRG